MQSFIAIMQRYGLPVLSGGVVLFGLYATSLYSDLLFHNLVELAGIIVSLLVFTLVWNTRQILENRYVLFMGISSLFSGALIIVHTLTYRGMEVLPHHATDMVTQFWIAYRYVLGFSFLTAPVFLTRKLPVGAVFAVYAAVTSALAASILLGRFPRCYVDGEGMTLFKIGSEYAVTLVLAAAFGLLYRKREFFSRRVFGMIALSMLASLFSVISYTHHPFVVGPTSVAGHFFELLATYAIYQAFVVTGLVDPAGLLYHGLKQSEEALRRSNEALQSEIAERRRAEERLVVLATAVRSAAEAVVITDPATGIVQYVNPVFEQMTGYTQQETLGRTLHFIESGKDDQEHFRSLREALDRDGVWRGKLMNKKKDGTPYLEECTVSVVRSDNGDVVNYIHLKRDVTEKMRLASATDTVRAMEDIGHIFSGLRNEIGNPVNSMNMILGILRNKLDSLPGMAVRNYLNLMADQVARVEYLLRSLKSFSLYETQDLQNVAVPVFLDTLLAPVREDFGRKGIELSVSVAPDAAWVRADPQALQQVLLNVLTNASEAVNGMAGPKVAVAVTLADGMVRIQVRDNGRGIAEEKLKDVFRPFYTTKQQGSGLGLVIVKKMLARMQGTIEIHSRMDEGTTVDMAIPEGSHADR